MAQEDFALVLLDVAMPRMTGFELADRLKEDERTRHIPIVFLTAIACGAEDVYRGYRVSAVDYLIKPLDLEADCAKVEVFADLDRQRREIEERDQRLGIDHTFGWTADREARRLSFAGACALAVLG